MSIVLGSAAGGGVPQWNCGCARCVAARSGDVEVPCRTQASLAVHLGQEVWALVNATTDLTAQINAQPDLRPAPGSRGTPIRRVLLTDAQLDHVLGLFELRQAAALEIFGPSAVIRAVRDDLGLGRTLAPYLELTWRELILDEPVELWSAITVRAIDTGGGPPRYAPARPSATWTVAYEIAGRAGQSLVYAPAVGAISGALVAACRRATHVVFDGTFWADDEPERSGIGLRSAREMGHVPIGGPGGSLEVLTALPAVRIAYTHVNNTNPILDRHSPERSMLDRSVVGVVSDGEVLLT